MEPSELLFVFMFFLLPAAGMMVWLKIFHETLKPLPHFVDVSLSDKTSRSLLGYVESTFHEDINWLLRAIPGIAHCRRFPDYDEWVGNHIVVASGPYCGHYSFAWSKVGHVWLHFNEREGDQVSDEIADFLDDLHSQMISQTLEEAQHSRIEHARFIQNPVKKAPFAFKSKPWIELPGYAG